jgi:hypothetical protein
MNQPAIKVTQNSIGLSELLAVTLIVLKAFDKIDMPWFWVITSIIWIPISIVLVLLIIFLGIPALFIALASVASSIKDKLEISSRRKGDKKLR